MPKPNVTENTPNWRHYFGLIFFLFLTLVFSSFLLVLNAGLSFSLYSGVRPSLPDNDWVLRVGQLALYSLPVLLLFLEWYLIDSVIDKVLRRS